MGSAARRTLAVIVSRKARTDSYTAVRRRFNSIKKEEKKKSGENFEQMTVKVTRNRPNPQQDSFHDHHARIIDHHPSSILMLKPDGKTEGPSYECGGLRVEPTLSMKMKSRRRTKTEGHVEMECQENLHAPINAPESVRMSVRLSVRRCLCYRQFPVRFRREKINNAG